MKFAIPVLYILIVSLGVLLTEMVGQTAANREVDSSSRSQSYFFIMLPEKEATAAEGLTPLIEVPSDGEIAKSCHSYYQSCTKACKTCEADCRAVRDMCLSP